MRRSLLLLALLSMAACTSTTQLPMSYQPTVGVSAETPRRVIGPLATAIDRRESSRDDPFWIGTIRGGYGNPLKALRADRPVGEVVTRAFADGLAARGLVATGTPRYALAITIHDFNANQYARREATADFSLVLTNLATRQEVWRDRHRAYNIEGSIMSFDVGIFANIEDLRRVALRTMSQAVDTLLDKPSFRAALLL